MELHIVKFIGLLILGIVLALITDNTSITYLGYLVIMFSVFFIVAGIATVKTTKW